MKNKLLRIKFFYYIYKLIKITRNKKPSYHFAEFAEDVFIDRILQNTKKGFYVDVGCYHPYKGSLTYKLYKRNWSGLNIDISKISKDLFELSRKKDINLNLAVTDYDGEIFYYENSPINQQNSLIKANDNQKKIKIKCNTLNTILDTHKISSIDFLNIDVEGAELNVIKGIDFKKYKPKLISIENNELFINDYINSEIFKILSNNKYTYINKIGVTNFFLIKDLADNFSNEIKI